MSSASALFRSLPPQAKSRKLEPDEAAKRGAELSEQMRAMAEGSVAKAFPDLWAQLTPEGQRRLVDELFEAFKRHPLRSPNAVVEAWYRTLELRQDADRETHHKNADSIHSEEPITTSEDLKHRLGL